MVLSPAPVAKQKTDAPGARTLAYEQAISQPREERPEAKSDDTANPTSETDVPAFETVTTPADTPQDVAALPDESADALDGAGETQNSPQDTAAVPGAQPSPYDSVPPLPGEEAPGQNQWGTDGAEQWGDEQDTPWADGPPPGDPYGPPGNDPYAQDDPYGSPGGDPYAQGDPYGPRDGDPHAQGDPYAQDDPYAQGGPNAEEWVEVIISGSAMRATASEDAPMLFAFPYGRNLKVVSRYEGWVEVIDPQSSATGWMQAHALAPSRANRGYGQTEAYYDQPRRGDGWLRRNADGFADMLNRALGGAF
jgi:hypothetical protein